MKSSLGGHEESFEEIERPRDVIVSERERSPVRAGSLRAAGPPCVSVVVSVVSADDSELAAMVKKFCLSLC